MNERDKIVLGALFHDIGKVVYRASQRPSRKTHQELGSEWIKGHLSQIFGDDVARELADFALYHHFSPKNHPELDVRNQNRNDLLLVAHADSVSSGERKKIDYDDTKFDPSRPLRSAFSSIKTEGKPEAKPVFYTLRRLSEGIFYPRESLKLTPEDYQMVLNEFENALKEKMLNPDALLNVLEEYFSLIPSHTAEAEGVGTDVSLYDHLKTTAAIALAAYNYLAEVHGIDEKETLFSQLPSDEITDTKTKRYMFIGVDISGIQNFIYTISSKGALKLLRARSFYVEMLLEFLAIRILKELNLYRTNLLFLGGGNFIILAQNTENARKSVDLIIHDFNERLFDEHQGKLWLVHDYVEFEG
ncbi:MAG: type III-A CRISPR-associated protein Cas10/Csm1, partial [Candidatus Hydrothermota bacterium]